MKYQFIFGLSAALLTCAATIAMGQSSAFASTSDGLIPSDNAICKPIPAKWKPGTKVKETDFYEHHPNNEKSKLDMEIYVYESSRVYELTRDLLNQHCLWLQRVGGDWYTVGGKNARNSGKFNHSKHQPLDIKEAVFVKKDEVKPKPIINFDYFNNGRWHGTIEYLEQLKTDEYLVLLSYYRNAYVKHLCELRENGEFWELVHCGRPIMRPYWKYGDTTIENLENFKPQKKMPDGSFGSANPWGNFSVLKNKKGLPVWLTTLGPIQVFSDNTNFGGNEAQFAAKFAQHSNGVIRLWTDDGKAYHGYWARKCHGYTSYDQWWGKKNNTVVTRDYQTCPYYKDKIEKKGWSLKYTTLDGSPTSCWGSITATKNPEDNTLNGVMEDCAIGVFSYKKYDFFANMVGADSPAVAKPDAIKPVAVKPATVAPVTVFQDCPECPEMVVVPPGEFMMGSWDREPKRDKNEGPVHRVTIPAPFGVGKYEVTFDEWDACVSAGGCSKKTESAPDEGWGRGRRPVIHVNFDDTQEYVIWLSKKTGKTYRLLSEAEWEYVARAGTTTLFHTGDNISTSQANFNWTIRKTAPVGNYPSNQFGLHDVHGNVSEWVEDCFHENYEGAPVDGSAWTTFENPWDGNCYTRVLRGGSWKGAEEDGSEPRKLRSASRSADAAVGWDARGFRVARTLKTATAKTATAKTATAKTATAKTATAKTATVTPTTETYAFDTDWGLLTVHSDDGVNFEGTYGKKGGRVIGIYDDGDRAFRGFWDKPKAKKKCSREKRGLIYWGKIEFQLSSTEDSFTGVWGYCDDQPTHSWNGSPTVKSASAAETSNLPPCPEDQSARFHMCFGTYNYKSGSKYVGEWRNNDTHGQGTLTYKSGAKYVGEYKDGKKHGQGTYIWANGSKYVGEYKDGKRNGWGTKTWDDGHKYVGEFKDGKSHGQGTFTWPDGGKYFGEYKDGKQHGQGTFTYANGDKYVGEYKDDDRHGYGTYTFADGRSEKCLYENGEEMHCS